MAKEKETVTNDQLDYALRELALDHANVHYALSLEQAAEKVMAESAPYKAYIAARAARLEAEEANKQKRALVVEIALQIYEKVKDTGEKILHCTPKKKKPVVTVTYDKPTVINWLIESKHLDLLLVDEARLAQVADILKTPTFVVTEKVEYTVAVDSDLSDMLPSASQPALTDEIPF